jgi:hypothetical protein
MLDNLGPHPLTALHDHRLFHHHKKGINLLEGQFLLNLLDILLWHSSLVRLLLVPEIRHVVHPQFHQQYLPYQRDCLSTLPANDVASTMDNRRETCGSIRTEKQSSHVCYSSGGLIFIWSFTLTFTHIFTRFLSKFIPFPLPLSF